MGKEGSVRAVRSMVAMTKSELLEQVGDGFRDMPISSAFLGVWCGLAAAETGGRVVYTPFLSAEAPFERREWDRRVGGAEREAFARRAAAFIPEPRFLSPLLSLDPRFPYEPAHEEDRAAVLEDVLPPL